MSAPKVRLPSAPPEAAESNRRESAVLDALIRRLASTLADRDGVEHAPPWEPKRQVLLGVLTPTRVFADPTLPPSGDGPITVPAAPPVSTGPPAPSFGLDFRVRTAASGAITLNIEVSFALYLERIATLEQQRTYIGSPDPVDDEPPAGAAPACDPPPPVTETAALPIDTPDDGIIAATPDPSPPQTAPTPAPPTATGKAKTARAKKSRLLGAWRRSNVTIEPFALSVTLDGAVATVSTPLTAACKTLIDQHYAQLQAMRPFATGPNQIPLEALDDDQALAAAVAAALDHQWAPAYPELTVTAFAQPLGGDEYLVTVVLRNDTELQDRTLQDLSVYDCQLEINCQAGTALVPQRFQLAPDDYRVADLATVIGHGTSCVAVATDAGGIRSETLPAHVQHVVEPRSDHVQAPRWQELADDPTPIMSSIEAAMIEYAQEFDEFVDACVGLGHREQAERDRDQFADELRRFQLGRRALKEDPLLAQAFQLANEVFTQANQGNLFDTWRLFQLVYIVTHLPALAAREHDDPLMRAELDVADVLWFPAGGGKTEAYLGLILTALFYDRLRGKSAGVTAWLRFPLRMLSVQQLFRTLKVLVLAEDLRRTRHIGPVHADPFALGYLVGRDGSPNQLEYANPWWKGWEAEARSFKAGTFAERHAGDRLITRCPYCGQEKVVMDLDPAKIRILHRCQACERILPLHMTDEEVYRSLPAVVISTVDKLSGYTWFAEYTAFSRGPRYRCPDHGYFSFPIRGTCLVGPDLCPPPKAGHPEAASFKDPVPALTIQDEMHLLKEDLGAFGGHYEGLIAELQRGGPSRLPSKILAASATIEQFEDQLRQIYGRVPRAFPSAGFDRRRNFYTQLTPDVRRVFLGVLPHYRRKADVAAVVQTDLIRAITHAEAREDPQTELGLADDLWSSPPTAEQVRDLLFDYDVSLGYVNNKSHGSKLDEELGLLSDELSNDSLGALSRAVLTGAVPIPDLADAIARVQGDTRAMDRGQRLRALVGTSVVSHGVDLDRLNLLIMTGMPTTAADYIQVTARSGRTHAGLVVTIYDTYSRRERSLFSHFSSYHQFLDQMVTPVPVNKYAFFVADRTVPGLAMALLHDLAREPSLSPPAAGVKYAKDFQPWWRSNKDAISATVAERLRRCYQTPILGVNAPDMERELADRALSRWLETESPALSNPAQERSTVNLFNREPLSNFRDIDEAADFVVQYRSREAYDALVGEGTTDATDTPEGQS